MKIILPTALIAAAFPALAQSGPEDNRTRFRELTTCVERSIRDYDDRISSADVVARALVRVCQTTTPQPQSPDPAGVIGALQDAALVSVLKARVQAAAPAPGPSAAPSGSARSRTRARSQEETSPADDPQRSVAERPRRSRQDNVAERPRQSRAAPRRDRDPRPAQRRSQRQR